MLSFIGGVSKKAKEICTDKKSFSVWARNHIAMFPQDATYINAYDIEIVHENEPAESIEIESLQATFSPTKTNSEPIISSDPETDELLRDTQIRGSKRKTRRDISQDLSGLSISPPRKIQSTSFNNLPEPVFGNSIQIRQGPSGLGSTAGSTASGSTAGSRHVTESIRSRGIGRSTGLGSGRGSVRDAGRGQSVRGSGRGQSGGSVVTRSQMSRRSQK